MKTLLNAIVIMPAIMIASFLAACSSSEKKSGQGFSGSDSSSSFQIRPYKVEAWDNGLQVILIEEHSLPSISFSLMFKEGSASDPMGKSGLANLLAEAMGRGTVARSADEIADSLGEMGTGFEKDVADDYMWFQISGLSPHQEKLFDIFSDIILHPRFDTHEIEVQKKLVLAGMEQALDHPEQLAELAFDAYIFGGHPYAHPVSGIRPDVKSLTRKDLLKAYRQKIRPNSAILVITGDFKENLIAKIKNTFLPWSKQESGTQENPTVPAVSGVNIRLIDKPDVTQSQIIIGGIGIKRNDPDYLPLRLASVILGGDFSSRLMSQIRVNLGLTYGISSSFDARTDRGPFEISTFTKNKTVGKTIDETLKVLSSFVSDGVTKDEVETAKNFVIGAFPRVIEKPEQLGFNLAFLRLNGISDNYLKDFISNVANLSKGDVNDAIKRHIDAKNLKILILSNAAEVSDELRPMGLLEIKKYTEVF